MSDIKSFDTTNIEPKSRMWDDAELFLRDENDAEIQSELLDTLGTVTQVTSHSESIYEDYFTAPIGNKPIEKDESKAEQYNLSKVQNMK